MYRPECFVFMDQDSCFTMALGKSGRSLATDGKLSNSKP